jgi:SAM-dependent methyltransferase
VGRHEAIDGALRFFNTRQHRFVVQRTSSDTFWHDRGDGSPIAIAGRRLAAALYLSGEGLEIGALNGPLELPSRARARYVDRLELADLRVHYPGLDLVPIDIVDDGESLASVALASQDFIVANHFLEHCQDPIRTLETLTARVRPGGVLYFAVPDGDQTFDAERPSTPFDHVLGDHASGPEGTRHAHYVEWVGLVEHLDGDQGAMRVAELEEMAYSIHFHVWRLRDLLELFTRAIDDCGVPLQIEFVMRHGIEVICVARRVA